MDKKTNFNIISKFKYWMLIPIVLVLASIVIGAIFGLNLDYDFRNVTTFDVKFGTTVTEVEYKNLEKSLDSLVDNVFDDYRIERIGEGAQNGLHVRIPNKNGEFDSKIDELKTTIEEVLVTSTSGIESSLTVTTKDNTNVLPKNITSLIWYSILAVVCIWIFVFLYNVIRYNFATSIIIVLTNLLEIAMLTSVMIVARIPFNYYFVVSYFVMIISSILITTYINNHIRTNLNVEKYNKYSNSDRVYDAYKATFIPVIILMSIMILSLLAIMFFGSISLIYTVISIIVSLIISGFGIYFFHYPVWSFYYKKDKDRCLKRRIEADKRKAEKAEKANANKEDEKIVV